MLFNFSITDEYVNEFAAKMEKPSVFFSNIWQKISVFWDFFDADDKNGNEVAQKSSQACAVRRHTAYA